MHNLHGLMIKFYYYFEKGTIKTMNAESKIFIRPKCRYLFVHHKSINKILIRDTNLKKAFFALLNLNNVIIWTEVFQQTMLVSSEISSDNIFHVHKVMYL